MANRKSKSARMQLARVIEVDAASGKSIEEAIRFGLGRVARTVGHTRGTWVGGAKVCTTPDVEIAGWRVDMRVSFLVGDEGGRS